MDSTGQGFAATASYKCVYVFSIDDNAHKGLLKIGDASVHSSKPIDQLPPNCHDLNVAARKRIDSYTMTAGIAYQLLHTELAVRYETDGKGKTSAFGFRDHDVKRLLRNSGIACKKVKGTKGREWYPIDLSTARAAITAVKQGKKNLSGTNDVEIEQIILRPEQKDAVKKTVDRFKKSDRMLWNAKMRFGKTLSALEVVKECGFGKTIIVTHRPVVDAGWYDDFRKIFHGYKEYVYGSRSHGYSFEDVDSMGKPYVYFASMQDLRGSKRVGGKFDKNDGVFDCKWDCVIVDEAHEGTTTALGDSVIHELVKDGTKFLALSGTPFNIIDSYSEQEVYTWDYVMEQEAKARWDEMHFGDTNPYEDLPELRIYTYDLGEAKDYVSLEDKAFNFSEFFRTWTGSLAKDHEPMPQGASVGDFVHEKDVRSFLNLMCDDSKGSLYPFSTEKYRELFRHSFWIVPGVKQALALQRLMESHPVFGSGAFDLVNVAGDGDPEDPKGEALAAVKEAIASAGDGYTITISCGKLTTGVTVPEWTAVFMLAGSYSTSVSSYMQTIFRVQSPCSFNGKAKEVCYAFDFAPDRTLKMVAGAVSVSGKEGKGKRDDKIAIGKFLNFCPVVSVSGSKMEKYNTGRMMQQLKVAYAERAMNRGFDDSSLYNEELMKLDESDLDIFKDLKAALINKKTSNGVGDVVVNDQGLTDEEYEKAQRAEKKPKRERTPEEAELFKKLNEAKKQRKAAIALLRNVSIRMPLLIFGADVPYGKDVTLDQFIDLVDDASWAEFMPAGVDKDLFRKLQKFYDEDVFISAGRRIRDLARHADTLDPTDRVAKIGELFSHFKNPDKETVLTPWSVVNTHMAGCLGGWCFLSDSGDPCEEPRYVDRGEVTARTLSRSDSVVLEVNSKSGLYPLYVTYSIYRSRRDAEKGEVTQERAADLWATTVRENVYVVCKTPMAKAITKRTLVGFTNVKVNAKYFDDLINQMQNKRTQLVDKITNRTYWKKGAKGKMEFSAVVGNPPYQRNDGGHGTSASPVYQEFVLSAIAMNPEYVSMITPSRWFGGGKGLDKFRATMLSDHHMSHLTDYPRLYEPFRNVKIRGGISYYLWDRSHDGPCEIQTIMEGEPYGDAIARPLDEYDILVRWNNAIPIIKKVLSAGEPNLSNRVSARKPFGLATNFSGGRRTKTGMKNPILLYANQKTVWTEREDIPANTNLIDEWKVLVTRAQATSAAIDMKGVSTPIVAGPGTACTETYLIAGHFQTEDEARSLESYLRSRFARFLVLMRKYSQDVTREVYGFVPDVPYDRTWTDKMLYERYGLSSKEISG